MSEHGARLPELSNERLGVPGPKDSLTQAKSLTSLSRLCLFWLLTHPAYFLFFSTLLASVVMAISATSWLMVWLTLEINLLSFIPMLTDKKNKYSSEAALKYFLVQALASVVVMASASLTLPQHISYLWLALAFLLKSGAAPSHQWVPAVVDGLSWPLVAILTTVQKLTPLMAIFFLLKADSASLVMMVYITLSALIGSLGGLTQSSLRKIMAYSSITHLSWILTSLMSAAWVWLLYFGLYSWVLLALIALLNQSDKLYLAQLITMNKSYLFFILAAALMSMGGLPPFTGFLPKLMVAQDILHKNYSLLMLPLLTGTFISLFFYARVLLTGLLLSNSRPSWLPFKNKFSTTALNLNLGGLLIPTLCVVFL
nr:TPA_asm: ND2 [Marinogammarus marinus]